VSARVKFLGNDYNFRISCNSKPKYPWLPRGGGFVSESVVRERETRGREEREYGEERQ
jgi:hypothetical protein